METFRIEDNKEFVGFLRKKLNRKAKRLLKISTPIFGRDKGKAIFPKGIHMFLVNLFLVYRKINGKLEITVKS